MYDLSTYGPTPNASLPDAARPTHVPVGSVIVVVLDRNVSATHPSADLGQELFVTGTLPMRRDEWTAYGVGIVSRLQQVASDVISARSKHDGIVRVTAIATEPIGVDAFTRQFDAVAERYGHAHVPWTFGELF